MEYLSLDCPIQQISYFNLFVLAIYKSYLWYFYVKLLDFKILVIQRGRLL